MRLVFFQLSLKNIAPELFYPCKRKRTCRKYNFAISPMKPQESKPTEIMRGYRDKIFVLLTIFIAIIFVGLNYCARKTNSSLSPLES